MEGLFLMNMVTLSTPKIMIMKTKKRNPGIDKTDPQGRVSNLAVGGAGASVSGRIDVSDVGIR